MTTYKIKPNGFSEIKKKVVSRVLPLFIFLLAVIVYLDYSKEDSSGSSLITTIILVVGVLSFAWFRAMKIQKELFESYQVTIDNETIIRERKNTPTIRIEKAGITEIVRGDNGNLIIKTARKADFIYIPLQLENVAELERVLNIISTIKPQPEKSFMERNAMVLPFLVIVLYAIVYRVTDKYTVLLAGTCLVAFLIWSMVEIQKSKNIEKGIKRSSYWSILVIATVIASVVSRFI